MKHASASCLPFCLGQVSYLELSASCPPVARLEHSRHPLPLGAESAPAAPDTLRFVLRQAYDSASYLHLALFCRERQLAHWVLPNACVPQPAARPATYLVEAPESLGLPARVIDEGSCLLHNFAAAQTAFLEQDLRAGHVQLTFCGRKLHGAFSLERLHSQSHTWELGRFRPLPPSHWQAVA